jgi:hypothetical protein
MGDELDLKSLWSLIGKKIGTLGIGDSSTKTAQGIMDGATWLKNNKTVQNIGKDIASGATMGNGISAFAKKMQWLQNNPDATSEESKAFDGSIDTPAERDWLQKMQLLSENPEITEEQKKILGINVMRRGGDTIQNLGIGIGRGLDTPAERQYQLGAGAMPTGQPNMGALGMRAEFNRQMSALPPQEVQRVQQILAQLNDEQRQVFMQGVANGNTPLGGYGVQNESYRL